MLLTHEDGPPILQEVGAPASRWIFVCDHASNRVPRRLGTLGMAVSDLGRHIAYDIGAEELTRYLAAHFRANAIYARFSRLVIDVNRLLDDPTSIPDAVDGTRIPGNACLDDRLRLERQEVLFAPFHGAIAGRIATMLAGPRQLPIVVGVHTMTPRMDGRERPEIAVVWRHDKRLATPLIRHIQAGNSEITVGENDPYSRQAVDTMTLDHHAEAKGLPNVLIEVRQDLVSDARGQGLYARLLALALEAAASEGGF